MKLAAVYVSVALVLACVSVIHVSNRSHAIAEKFYADQELPHNQRELLPLSTRESMLAKRQRAADKTFHSTVSRAGSETPDLALGAQGKALSDSTVKYPHNIGEGAQKFKELDMSPQDLEGYDSPAIMKIIALDVTIDPEVGNAALNNLRKNDDDIREVTLSIVKSKHFNDDYRACATQHLVLHSAQGLGSFQSDSWYLHILQPLLNKNYPVAVQREAVFGLCDSPKTRPVAVSWMIEKIKGDSPNDFLDLYLRICKQYALPIDAAINNMPVQSVPGK